MKVMLKIFSIMLILSSCNTNEAVDNTVSHVEDDKVYDDKFYPLYYLEEYEKALYEPDKGAYLGAHVISNSYIDYDFKSFEDLANKDHASYLHNMYLGEDFPSAWLLECLANNKIPQIIVYPSNRNNPYTEEYLDYLVDELSSFYTPIFLHFYPNPISYKSSPEEYIDFYQLASDKIKDKAKNVSLVWSVDYNDVFASEVYYPGDDYVDWLGLNLYMPIYVDDKKNDSDIWDELNYFYLEYQKTKPIMLSQVAISHFSTQDHVYYIKESSEIIKKIYENVKDYYPRIKAINYMEFNNIEIAPDSAIKDDFSLSSNEEIIKTYQNAISDDYFLTTIDLESKKIEEKFLSSANILKREDDFFISEQSLKDLTIKIDDYEEFKIKINSDIYYPLKAIIENENLDFTFDSNKNFGLIKNVS